MSIKFLLLLITTIITGCDTESNTNNSITDSSEITTPVAEVITNTFPSEIIIVGEVKVGSQLSTVIKDDDGFDNNDVIYQWYADDVEIDNATFSTLLLTDAQLRLTITVIATFNDDLGFKEIAVSAATDAVWRINVKGKVIVNGTPEINNKLVADVFDEDGISSEIAYKWYANDLEIADETHSLLMLTDAQLGSTIKVSAVYKDTYGHEEQTMSESTRAVSRKNNESELIISGYPIVGNTLFAEVIDLDGTSFDMAYQWYANNIEIPNEVHSSLLLTDAQLGSIITVSAAFKDNYGFNEQPLSASTQPVWRNNNEGEVNINGVPIVGNTLFADVQDSDGDPSDVFYQWYADNIKITDEVYDSLILTEFQLGKVIAVNAVFKDGYGFSESVISSPTEPVQSTNTKGTVVIQGLPIVGDTLFSEVYDADDISLDIAYQWFADEQIILGATNSTLSVSDLFFDKKISVRAIYTDDRGFIENNLSEQTSTVSRPVVNETGSIAIIGDTPYISNNQLSAEITDVNGFSQQSVIYTWFADGVKIDSSNNKTFTPNGYVGSIISVTAKYIDNDGFSNNVSDTLSTIIYTLTVSDEASLLGAVNGGLADGDIIGLNTGTYVDMDSIVLTSGVTLRATDAQVPIISGELCVHITDSANGATLTGLTFKDIDMKAGSICEKQEETSILSEGDNFTFSQNTIDGEEKKLNKSKYHWITLKGKNTLIERNTFSKRNTAKKGSVIKMSTSGSDQLVQYNLFKDSSNLNFNKASLHLIKVGSSSGASSAKDLNFTIQYNRIENFVTGRRLIRVQSSGVKIKGNTIVNPSGGITLEDGGFNSITDNIIIRATKNANSKDRPSGILITPLGHTISNNYIAGIHSRAKETGGIVFTAAPFSKGKGGKPNVGNQAILDQAGDFTLTITNNTVLNSQQPVLFSTEVGPRAGVKDCHNLTASNNPTLYSLTKNSFVINFTGNLVANGLNDDATTQGLYYPYTSPSDHVFEYDCDLINHTNSIFSNNFGYTHQRIGGSARSDWVEIRDSNGNGAFSLSGAIDQDPANTGKEILEFVTAKSTLLETAPSGAQYLAGAKELHYIQASEVGVGSIWQSQNN